MHNPSMKIGEGDPLYFQFSVDKPTKDLKGDPGFSLHELKRDPIPLNVIGRSFKQNGSPRDHYH